MKTLHRSIVLSLFCFCLVVLISDTAFGWHDRTHLAIAKAAGYAGWYNAAGPDIAKIKAGNTEATNHWFNNTEAVEVTESMVLDQATRYNKASDADGHLYGAIMTSLKKYIQDQEGERLQVIIWPSAPITQATSVCPSITCPMTTSTRNTTTRMTG